MSLRRMRCGRVFRLGAVLAVALAFAMTLVPAVALAATQLTHGYLRYELQDKSITIVDYAGDEEEVFVPAYIAGNPVNHIAMGAFYDSWTVKKVYLPDTVTDVDEGAFAEDQEVIFQWNAGRGYAENPDKESEGGGGSSGNPDTKDEGKESGSVPSDTSNGSLGLNGGLLGIANGRSGYPFGAVYPNPLRTNFNPSSTASGNQNGPTGDSSTSGIGRTTGSATYSSSSAAPAAGTATASGAPAVDVNTVQNAGTPATGVVTTAAGATRTPATGDPTSHALPVALIAVGPAVIGVAIVRMRRS